MGPGGGTFTPDRNGSGDEATTPNKDGDVFSFDATAVETDDDSDSDMDSDIEAVAEDGLDAMFSELCEPASMPIDPRMQALSDDEVQAFLRAKASLHRSSGTDGGTPTMTPTVSSVKPTPTPSLHLGNRAGQGSGAAPVSASAPISNLGLGLVVASAESIGGRHSMEDAIALVTDLQPPAAGGDGESKCASAYFAVYDGHNGAQTSQFLRRTLHANIAAQSSFATDPEAAMRAAFEQVRHIAELLLLPGAVPLVLTCAVLWCGRRPTMHSWLKPRTRACTRAPLRARCSCSNAASSDPSRSCVATLGTRGVCCPGRARLLT